MIFNSIAFFVFAAVFFPLYFMVKGRVRLMLCLFASYFFYGWWDYRFLVLIFFSTCIDYFVGLKMADTHEPQKRKGLLILSMIVNLGFLGFFKYFNFFIGSFEEMLTGAGFYPSFNTLHIILPVGISFYTFQSMSYTIDVFNKKIEIERDFIRFATFISFFPQLVAGPIVRASEFLPQFQKDRDFDWNRLTSGLGLVLWGFFKKVAVADSLAPFVDQCFEAPTVFPAIHLITGVVFYSFQIYCDFSGYSDIAIGLARILGFDFPVNFRTPYFSKNFSEFWTRWHISLSSWLRDYLYIPLGGNRGGSFGSVFFILLFMLVSGVMIGWWMLLVFLGVIAGTALYMRGSDAQKVNAYTYINLMVTMLLGGLWHGASWAFVFWGFLHGMYLVIQRLAAPTWNKILDALRVPLKIQNGMAIFIVYAATCLAWIYFRSPDFGVATQMINGILSMDSLHPASIINKFWVIKGVLLILFLLTIEIADFKWDFSGLVTHKPVFRVASFAVLMWMIAFFGNFGANQFIYFQF